MTVSWKKKRKSESLWRTTIFILFLENLFNSVTVYTVIIRVAAMHQQCVPALVWYGRYHAT